MRQNTEVHLKVTIIGKCIHTRKYRLLMQSRNPNFTRAQNEYLMIKMVKSIQNIPIK